MKFWLWVTEDLEGSKDMSAYVYIYVSDHDSNRLPSGGNLCWGPTVIGCLQPQGGFIHCRLPPLVLKYLSTPLTPSLYLKWPTNVIVNFPKRVW